MKWLLRILALCTAFTMVSSAQRPANGEQWFYRLTDGAAIMDDCPICDRVSVWHPLEGQFYVVGTSDPNRLLISSVSFISTAGPANPPYFFVSGGGEIRFEKGA